MSGRRVARAASDSLRSQTRAIKLTRRLLVSRRRSRRVDGVNVGFIARKSCQRVSVFFHIAASVPAASVVRECAQSMSRSSNTCSWARKRFLSRGE